MNSAWRWKFWFAVVCTVGAILCVLPNFVPEDSTAWYAKYVSKWDTKVQLGLDLKGGIQMTLGVDLDRALLNESERYARDLKEYLPKENIQFQKIERNVNSTNITAVLSSDEDAKKFKKFIYEKFTYLEVVNSNGNEFTLNIPLERQTDMETQTMAQAVETLRNRLDQFGVAEPSVQSKGKENIIIQLPGLADPVRAREILAQTAQLEFKMVDDQSLSSLELEKMIDAARKELPATATDEELNYKIRDKLPSGTEVAFEKTTDPTTKETRSIPYLLIMGERISGDLLDDARIAPGEFGNPVVSVQFNPQGTAEFDVMTKKNIGKRLAIILDGEVKSAPVLQSHIPDGRAQITLGASFGAYDATMKEATDLALVLRAGALPAPIEIQSTQAVGPSLGKDSIEKGIKAMMWGLVMIVIFMALYYRMSGIVADIAVVVNLIFTLACLGLVPGGAALTLPGIAGVLISLGMSVDTNIIIFERIRDELRLGKTVKAAVDVAYDRVFLTIIDTHLTAIITSFVLIAFGTGAVRGFAVTLIFGLVANFVTALWFTKLFYDWLIHKYEPKTLSI